VRARHSASAVGDVLKGLVRKLEKKKITQGVLDGAWRAHAGADAFKHSRPAGLKKKVLTVRVDSPAWLSALAVQERKILKGLKSELGMDVVTDLQLRIGEIDGEN
jgi:predicted nucleic acid-binding Zn ribbon protein